jgi:hypothetical protein
MNNLYDVLEVCLQELENGANLETVLARYPDLAGELRPILKAAVMAHKRSEAVPAPSQEAVRRGRAKLLQRASEMREAKLAPRKRMIPFFQRLAISFTLAALFLSSGTGLVSASSSALPGENLYPVKLTWENVRLFFTFNEEYRETLEHTFENERLHEVNELLVEGRHETIRFAGVYMEVNGMTYVSGIHIAVLDTSTLPTDPLLNGMAVEVTGHTNAEGFVDVESITLLPAGSAVPPGEPVEVGENHNSNDIENRNENENGNVNENSDENINEGSDDNNNVNDNESSADNNNDSDGANDNAVDDSNDDNTNDDNSGSDDNNGDDSSDSGGGGDDDSGDSGGGGNDSGGDDND